MGKAAKRARQKENRDRLARARAAELRRRNLIRLVVLVVLLALVAGIAVAASLGVGSPGSEQTASEREGTGDGEGAETVACNGERPPPPSPESYESAPPMRINPNARYGAVITTSCGRIEMELLAEQAPRNVNNFVFLAEEGFYDGLLFHRVEKDAVIQTGDPNGLIGQEPDGPGYTIPDELPASPEAYVFGTVGMANAGPDTAGSQFFFVVHDYQRALRGKRPEPAGFRPDYSVFGEVDRSSWDVLQRIASVPTEQGDDPVRATMPVDPVYIESVDITRR